MSPVRRALISVHDKTGVVEFARGLAALGVEILSTGGTARLLRESGVAVVEVADVTGFPEMLDGRVKTLHPKVHGGILARRDRPEHMAALDAHGIGPIDLVAVTLYPFEATAARPGVTFEEVVENIDIGGPSMIRGAAKNHDSVGVVTDPAQYASVLAELSSGAGELSAATRSRLAFEAFRRTAQYDAAIATYLRDPGATGRRPQDAAASAFPERLHVEGSLVAVASLRREPAPERGVLSARRPGLRALRRRAAPRPRARLQQPPRLVGRARPAPRVRGSRRGGDQAHQPVRRRDRERRPATRCGRRRRRIPSRSTAASSA